MTGVVGHRDERLERVAKAIQKEGFITEMLVTSAVTKAGWEALDHIYYVDRDENKGRECDLVACYRAEAASERKVVRVAAGLAVEIKKSTSRPLVLFLQPKSPWLPVEGLFDTTLVHLNIQEIWFKDLYSNHPIAACEQFGRVACHAFAPSDDELAADTRKSATVSPFSGFATVFKAVHEVSAHMKQQDKTALRNDEQLKTYEVGIAHGLVIVDGPIIAAEVRSRDDILLRYADWAPYAFSYASEEYGTRTMLIDVISMDYLNNYLERYRNWLKERASFCLRELS